MRILMLSKACIVGAYQRKLEELARLPDVELLVLVPPYWRDTGGVIPLEREHTRGYELVATPMALNGHFHLHFYPHLGRHMRRFRPELVHIDEEPYNLATFQAMWLARRLGAKALFFTWQNLLRRYPPPFSWIEAYNLRHADYAICGNREAGEVLRAKGYRGALKVIPQFGVDPSLYRPLKKGGEARGTVVIGYVGRLVREKGVHLLLQAAAKLRGEWELRILGRGPERDRLQALARKLGVADRVAFLAPLPSSRMPAYLNELDVLVLPSLTHPHWKEQFGRVLVEAMACGVAVVGSTCGEIPHVVGEAGLLFPEGDADALSHCLARLIHDAQLRAELALRGRRRVLEHFTQAQVAQATYQVYREILGREG